MGYLWDIYGKSMEYLWEKYGISMGKVWNIYGINDIMQIINTLYNKREDGNYRIKSAFDNWPLP